MGEFQKASEDGTVTGQQLKEWRKVGEEARDRGGEVLSIPFKARNIVFEYVSDRLEKTDTYVMFVPDDVYVVWMSKTLQNWKACLSTVLPDGMYYEVTYDGNNKRAYLDAYKKFDNVMIPDEV